MNKKLNNDWVRKQGLFNNSILFCEINYTKEEQLKILQIIWEYLKSKFQLAETLFFLNDWHTHDGYISKEVSIDKKEFENMLTNPNQVFKNRDVDVYDLVYNEAETFMLRWYCNKEEDSEVYCDFTLVLSNPNELKKVENIIRENVANKGFKIKKAQQYFEEQYAG